jgi:GTP cyclohydrolase I
MTDYKPALGEISADPPTINGKVNLTNTAGAINVPPFITEDERTDKVQQRQALEWSIARIITWLGLPLQSEEFEETPRRVTDMLLEFRQETDLAAILKRGFENPQATGALVVQDHIPFRGLCAHHFCPFYGRAAIGYIPHKRVVGLSKLTRLVQAAGVQAPSSQEAITNKIADVISDVMEPVGVIVITAANHTCMSVRGINAPGVVTKVSALRGNFLHVPALRQEFFSLVEV